MGIFKIIRNTDSGLQYMYNALNYVTHGHTDYDKRYSMNTDIDNAYEQFLLVKRYFYKTSGNPVFHFVVVYSAKSTWGNNIERVECMSRRLHHIFRTSSKWCGAFIKSRVLKNTAAVLLCIMLTLL